MAFWHTVPQTPRKPAKIAWGDFGTLGDCAKIGWLGGLTQNKVQNTYFLSTLILCLEQVGGLIRRFGLLEKPKPCAFLRVKPVLDAQLAFGAEQCPSANPTILGCLANGLRRAFTLGEQHTQEFDGLF